MKKLTILILVLLLTACSKAAPKSTATNTPLPTDTLVTTAAPQTSTQTSTQTIMPEATVTQIASTPTTAPTATPIPQPTATTLPTETPTITPTATPFPPLADQGPYLVYLASLPEGGQAVKLLNADGSGRNILNLPANGFIPDVRNAVSPDGQWVAFYVGNIGRLESGQIDANSGPYTLTLNLMSLADGSSQQIASLLGADYPNNFKAAADQAIQAAPDIYKDITPEQLATTMIERFISGFYASGWSNNSQYYAFTGEINGPTSDIYVYNTTNERTLRLSTELEQVQWLTWSSDNLHLLYGTTNGYPTGTNLDNFRVTRIDGGNSQNLGQLGYRSGWASANVYTVYKTDDAGNFTGLTNVNILTKNATTIWTFAFQDFAFDLKDGSMSILGFSGEGADQQTGIYLQSMGWEFTPLNANAVFPRGSDEHRFVASSFDQGVLGIANDGTITTIRSQPASISISPNWLWMTLFDTGQSGTVAGIELYDEKDQLVRQITSINPNRIIWRTNSAGLFFRSGTDLYYVAIPDGEPVLLDQDVAINENGDYNNFVWVE